MDILLNQLVQFKIVLKLLLFLDSVDITISRTDTALDRMSTVRPLLEFGPFLSNNIVFETG